MDNMMNHYNDQDPPMKGACNFCVTIKKHSTLANFDLFVKYYYVYQVGYETSQLVSFRVYF